MTSIMQLAPKKKLTLTDLDDSSVFYVYAEYKLVNGELKCVSHYGGIKGKRTTRVVKPEVVKVTPKSFEIQVDDARLM